jgi:hypothetical protein
MKQSRREIEVRLMFATSQSQNQHDQIVLESCRNQLEYFTAADPRCRGLQLPEGVMLRYNLERSLYFYFRTRCDDGKINTQVYSTDCPFEMQKSQIGNISTPLFSQETYGFDPTADRNHVGKLEKLVHDWISFIKEVPDEAEGFSSFALDPSVTRRPARVF